MPDHPLYAGIAAAVVASLGLWWFRVILTEIKKQPKATRYGIYAAIWLAYFILTMMVLGMRN